MTSLKNIVIVSVCLASLVGGLFMMSLLTETFYRGSWLQTLTLIAFGVGLALFMPAAGTLIFGFMAVAWRQAESSRSILEVPTARGPKYIAEIPASRKVTLLALSEDEIAGVEIGDDQRAKGPRVRRAPEIHPNYIRANLPMPTAESNRELLHEYLREHGGNGK